MSLEYAILGLLYVMPMTGYDLKHQAFDASIAHFWPADQSQIYRTLSRLEDKGWATMRVEPQDERPDRKVFSITPEGLAALNEWLRTPQAPPTYRDPFLVQLFLGMEVPRADLLALVEARLAAHRAQMAVYEQIPITPPEQRPDDRWLALQHLTLEFGRGLAQLYIDWLEHCREVIGELPEPEESGDFRARFNQPPQG